MLSAENMSPAGKGASNVGHWEVQTKYLGQTPTKAYGFSCWWTKEPEYADPGSNFGSNIMMQFGVSTTEPFCTVWRIWISLPTKFIPSSLQFIHTWMDPSGMIAHHGTTLFLWRDLLLACTVAQISTHSSISGMMWKGPFLHAITNVLNESWWFHSQRPNEVQQSRSNALAVTLGFNWQAKVFPSEMSL